SARPGDACRLSLHLPDHDHWTTTDVLHREGRGFAVESRSQDGRSCGADRGAEPDRRPQCPAPGAAAEAASVRRLAGVLAGVWVALALVGSASARAGGPALNVRAAALIDASTGQQLYGLNAGTEL